MKANSIGRGDPCTKCGKLGYFKAGTCRDCQRGTCPGCSQSKVLKYQGNVCGDCFRKKRPKKITETVG